MSRKIYTYTDLTKLNSNRNFEELLRFPQVTVSSDLRKSLVGTQNIDKVQGMFTGNQVIKVTDFHSFETAIYDGWNSDQSKFREIVILSEFMRQKIADAKSEKEKKWLNGCIRNISQMLSSILLLIQAEVDVESLNVIADPNITLLIEAWKYLEKNDEIIEKYKDRMKKMSQRNAWNTVFKSAFDIGSASDVDTIVFHGFYYITPIQERVMTLLEKAGINLIYLIQYNAKYPYAHEIWEATYGEPGVFEDKSLWHMEVDSDSEPYGEIFEGNKATITNNLEIKEYASIMEFVDDVKHIKEMGYSIYSADYKASNEILKDYFPEAFGDRKILSYPIGHFISTLNKMWDDENHTISLEEDQLIECFSSGWLSVDGVSGKQYMQDLMYILPFFRGCKNVDSWEKRIRLFEEINDKVIAPFEVELDADALISRWQEAIGSPLKNFSMFSVTPEKASVILKLIKQLLAMAKELFGRNEEIRIQDHIIRLELLLKKYELSDEIYKEEKELVADIFSKFGEDNAFDVNCHPADVARALELFLCGRFEDGEIQTNKVGLVYPLYFVDAACVKNNSKVHVCMSDIESLPGRNKEYIWPLTGKTVRDLYESTGNRFLLNLIHVMESTTECNRFFTFCALRNSDVTLSWVSELGDKKLAPSPYIKLLKEFAGVDVTPTVRNTITFKRANEADYWLGRIEKYDNSKAPSNIIKEARIDYALCPMKYVLGYVVEKYPTYQSDFQMNYALNAFISAIYNLMKSEGMKVEEAYEAVIELFPNMRKVEKRQVYDYLSYDRKEDDFDYGNRTECGERFYTDERLKLHFPNQKVRGEALALYGKLATPDGRKGLNLYEDIEVNEACMFCPHISYCKNAHYPYDQENSYD